MATPLATVSGIVSGIDTASLISQLMQVEAQPQTLLKDKLSDEQSKLTVMQSLNSKIAALATAAGALDTNADWSPYKATSSSTDVTVNPTSSAAPANISFTVDQVAVAHKVTYASSTALNAAVPSSITLTTSKGATTLTLDNPPTVQGLMDALNKTGEVRASAVKLDDGTYRLSVEGASTGAASQFSITADDGGGNPVDILGGVASTRQGADAQITVGTDQIHSATNTFAGVLPGVDLTISSAAVGKSVDVTVAADSTAAAGKAKSLVDSINSIIAEIKKQSAYNATAKTTGPLTGNYAFRSFSGELQNTIFPTNDTTLGTYGIQLDKDGNLTFDADKFNAAYASDPNGLKDALGGTDGFAARVKAVADNASGTKGYITSMVSGQNDNIKRIQDSIDDWDIRLEKREATLRSQFTAMETALSNLQAQGSWLASQLSSLSTD